MNYTNLSKREMHSIITKTCFKIINIIACILEPSSAFILQSLKKPVLGTSTKLYYSSFICIKTLIRLPYNVRYVAYVILTDAKESAVHE